MGGLRQPVKSLAVETIDVEMTVSTVGPGDQMLFDPAALPSVQRRNLELQISALGTVEPSPEEYRTLEWLAGFEDASVANVAALLRRATGA